MTNLLPEPHGTVLVVDDDPLLRALMAEYLEDAGFGIIEAANTADAITILETHPAFQAMVIDIEMPGCTTPTMMSAWCASTGPL